MAKIYRFLGKSGRTTIPYPLRVAMGFKRYDLVSFERWGDVVIVRKEKICDGCADGYEQMTIPAAIAAEPQKKKNTKGSGARKALKLTI